MPRSGPSWRILRSTASTQSRPTSAITVTGEDTEVLARCRTGAQCGRPAVTRRAVGGGSAYVSTRLGVEGLAALLPRLLEPAGVGSELPAVARGAVEPVVRRGPGGRFVFLVNRTEQAVPVPGVTGAVVVPGPTSAARAAELPCVTVRPDQVTLGLSAWPRRAERDRDARGDRRRRQAGAARGGPHQRPDGCVHGACRVGDVFEVAGVSGVAADAALLRKGHTHTLTGVPSGKALTLAGDGAGLGIGTGDGSAAQQWRLTAVRGDDGSRRRYGFTNGERRLTVRDDVAVAVPRAGGPDTAAERIASSTGDGIGRRSTRPRGVCRRWAGRPRTTALSSPRGRPTRAPTSAGGSRT